MGWDFVAIDFETATSNRNSPCSLGLTVVREGQIVGCQEYLIKPVYDTFNPICVRIHGIKETDVEDAPPFDVLWSTIAEYFAESLVVAHNASFDIGVLRSTLDLYDIPYPSLYYLCTEKISRKKWTNLINYRLDTICRHLDIPLENHHNAAEDSYACANILLKLLHEHNVSDVWKLAESIDFYFGYLSNEEHAPCSAPGTDPKIHHKASIDQFIPPRNRVDDSPISSHSFVFTGALDHLTRQQAMQIVLDYGGDFKTTVSKHTDYLVVGEFDYSRLIDGVASTKLIKARELAESGSGIQIISEKDFLRMIMGQELDKEEV